jgi:sugar lactone lactonase YvrE
LALVHLAGPASALEPGDLVIGVGTDLHAVEPATGTLRLLSDGLGPGEIPAIAVRADGAVFFRQVAFLAGTKGVWRLDPETGERRELAALDSGGGGLALDRDGSLVVPIADASPAVGAQPELRWLDAETGAVQRALPLPGSLIGISDLALDREGRILISTTRAGVRRVDPATGAVETLHLRGAFAVAVEADGSVLAAPCCGATNPPPILLRIDPDTGAAQALAMGGLLSFVTGIAVEADGAIVVTSEWLLAALAPDLGDSVFPPIAPASVVRVDPEDGAQTLVAGGLADAGAIAPPAVAIEVLPSRIRVGPSGRGILQVVLSASDPVDAESLAFGPAGAAPVRSLAVGRGRRATPSLLLFFRTGETGLAPGDREACLAGAIGVFVFDACDEVVVRGLPHGDQRR